MGACAWCHKSTNKMVRCSSLGNEYEVCMVCAQAFKKKVCRICGTPVGDTAIEGCCIMCAQKDYYEHKKVTPETEQAVGSGEPMTEDSFKRWMTFSQGNFTPQKHRESRRKWLATKLSGVKTWTPGDIEANIEDIDTLVEKNFYKVFGGKQVPVYLERVNGDVKILSRLNKVGLIDVKELCKLK